MKIVCCALMLIVCSGANAHAQERSAPRLILRPVVGFVPAATHTGSATIDGALHKTTLEYGKADVALGGQAELMLISGLFVAVGGQNSSHEITAAVQPTRMATMVKQDRELVYLWSALGIRTEYFSVLAGPLMVRETASTDYRAYYGRDATWWTCPRDGVQTYTGWTAGALFEIPISAGAKVSAGVLRHALSWGNAVESVTSRFYAASVLLSCQLLPSSSVTSSNPAIWNFQAGLAIPLF